MSARLDPLRQALRGLAERPARTASTALGHAAGVAGAVSLVGVGTEDAPHAGALAALCAAALVSGGVALARAMAGAVGERRRELAMRCIAGATRREIALEIALEALVLAALAGASGFAAAALVGAALSAWSAPVALALSLAAGLAAGLPAARRAASLDPVEALRGA
jgi:ABC-type antimicrobial peptide transport system permease subunit